jgi:hypothetical protein
MDPRALVIHLETPYAQYVPVLAAPELVLLAGLRWPTEYWAGLAIGWLEQGAPVTLAVAKELKNFSAKSTNPQSLRHRAFSLARDFERSHPIQELDVVRVVRLLAPSRPFEGTKRASRAPRVGDTGAVVHVYEKHDDSHLFAVESVDNEGHTIWLADFALEELHVESKHAGA